MWWGVFALVKEGRWRPIQGRSYFQSYEPGIRGHPHSERSEWHAFCDLGNQVTEGGKLGTSNGVRVPARESGKERILQLCLPHIP